MSDLALTTDWDLTVTNDDFVLASGLDLIIQNLKQRLNFIRGEYFLDTRQGVPYFQQIFIKNADPRAVNVLIKQVILTTLGVLALTQFSSSLDASSRVLTVTFRARTSEGPLQLQVVI